MPTVLVVDDSEVDLRLAGSCVQKGVDATVLYARNGAEALEQVEQQTPDLVITDLQMPEMDGLRLLTQLKEDHPRLPVILITAKGSETIAAEALRRGAASYVPKKSLAKDLPNTVAQVLSAARDDMEHSMLMHCMDRTECSYTIYNDMDLIRTLVSHFQEMLRCLPLGDETERLRVGIALYEALSNACYHGNLEIGGSVDPIDQEAFLALANERRSQSPWCDRKINVDISLDRESVRCVVRDEGPGFDPTLVADTLGSESAHEGGRGIILMHTIMDSIHYNKKGNEVTLVRHKVDTPDEGEDPED